MHKKIRGPCRIADDNYTVFKAKVTPQDQENTFGNVLWVLKTRSIGDMFIKGSEGL